jgi:hypothetical protein
MPCEIVNPSPPKSDKSVCRLALAIGDGEPHWNERSALRAHVDEAKRRELTPEKCVALLEREATD